MFYGILFRLKLYSQPQSFTAYCVKIGKGDNIVVRQITALCLKCFANFLSQFILNVLIQRKKVQYAG